MHQINLSEELFQDAQRRATAAGFATVDEFVAVVLSDTLHDEVTNLDHFFTPERLAELDQSVADVRAGKVMTLEQGRAELNKSREEWLNANPTVK